MGRNGLLGKYIYEITGWSMPFTSSAVVLAGIFVGLPFVVLICESNFRQLPKEIEDAALLTE
jgi:molybdate transport system permease protein